MKKLWVRRSDSSEASAIGIDLASAFPASSSTNSDPDVSDLLIKCCEVVFVGSCLPSELFLSLGSSDPLKPVSNRKSVSDLIKLAEKEAKSAEKQADDDDEDEETKAFVLCARAGSEARFTTTAVMSLSPISKNNNSSILKKNPASSSTTATTERKTFLPAAARRSTSASSTGSTSSATASKKTVVPRSAAANLTSPNNHNNNNNNNGSRRVSSASPKKVAPKPAWVERLNSGKNSGSARRDRSASSPSNNTSSTNLPPLHQPSPTNRNVNTPSRHSTTGSSNSSVPRRNNSSPKPLWGYSHLNSSKKTPPASSSTTPSSVPAGTNSGRTGRSTTPLNQYNSRGHLVSGGGSHHHSTTSTRSSSQTHTKEELEAELNKSTKKVAPHQKAHARSTYLHRKNSAERSHHNFTHQRIPLRENKSLVDKREEIQEESRDEMIEREREYHNNPNFAKGIRDSRTVNSRSNSRSHSRTGSEVPTAQQLNHHHEDGAEDTTKTFHHVVCDKFVPTWGLPRVCNRCKAQRRDHQGGVMGSKSLMKRRNDLNSKTDQRKPASAFHANGSIHYEDPHSSSTMQQQQHHQPPASTPQQQISRNQNDTTLIISTTEGKESHHEKKNKDEEGAVDTVASDSTKSDDDDENYDDGNRDKTVDEQQEKEQDDATNDNIQKVEQPKTTNGGGGGGVLGNFARVSAALKDGDDDHDDRAATAENESFASESSPVRYDVGDEDDAESKRKKNLAHFAEF